MSAQTLPIPGMTITPVGLEVMGGADFVCCVEVAATTRVVANAYRKETGEQPTGPRFADWVALNIWGAEK